MHALINTDKLTECLKDGDSTFSYTIRCIPFDEDYCPADNTRVTTNFANLARGDTRQANLRNALNMMNARFNSLADWDNARRDRYSLKLEIISVGIELDGSRNSFPAIEILKTKIVDHTLQQVSDGIVGNNFSSYVRDYDFSVRLPEHNAWKACIEYSGWFWGPAWQAVSRFCKLRDLSGKFPQTPRDLFECVEQ